jgi:hypothetical protein
LHHVVLAVLDECVIQTRIYRTGMVEAKALSVSTPPLPLVTIPLGNDIQAPAIGLFNGSRSPLQYCTCIGSERIGPVKA